MATFRRIYASGVEGSPVETDNPRLIDRFRSLPNYEEVKPKKKPAAKKKPAEE